MALPRGARDFGCSVIVVFPDHTHLLFLTSTAIVNNVLKIFPWIKLDLQVKLFKAKLG